MIVPVADSDSDTDNWLASAANSVSGAVSGMSTAVIIGIAIAALLLILMLWAFIPRRSDERIPVEEYRKRYQNKRSKGDMETYEDE